MPTKARPALHNITQLHIMMWSCLAYMMSTATKCCPWF